MLDTPFARADNPAMDPFAGIEAFVRVVETGSFTAAAAAMQTAKSSVSDTIRALEERLGVRLLDRTTRRVRPTEAGRAFHADCRRLLDEAIRARAALRARRETPAGDLRIGAPDGFAQRYILPALPGFLATHPAVRVDLVEATAFARLLDENLDLAIRIARHADPGWAVRRIGASPLATVASPAYLAAAGTPAVPADLARHHTIGFSPLEWRDTWRLGGEVVAVRPRVLTNNTESIRAAALAGLGIGVIPRWMVADALAAGMLAEVLRAHPPPASEIYAVYPTNRLITPAVRAFVDRLARELRRRAPEE
jgi:DNA-binding transcriptional LysR family regulator